MNNIYYVYQYLRTDNTPYYIGKGCRKRAWCKKRTFPPPTDKSRIVIVAHTLSESEAFLLEKKLIKVYGRKDLRTGILHNKTDGGEGASGFIQPKEANLVRSARLTGIAKSDEHKANMRKPKSSEHADKIRKNNKILNEARRGKPAHNKGISGPMKGVPKTYEHKAKMCKPKIRGVCPHCGKQGGINQLKRWHFDHCKVKLSSIGSDLG